MGTKARSFVSGEVYKGSPGEPSKPRKLRNVGREGFVECNECGRWVSVRNDGRLRGHRTVVANVICVNSPVYRDNRLGWSA
jgi:hypothetical protein